MTVQKLNHEIEEEEHGRESRQFEPIEVFLTIW
jgi:hypothetical protein